MRETFEEPLPKLGPLDVLSPAQKEDTQVGLGIRGKAIENLIPRIQNKNWFWEAEMLYIAQRTGYKIKEIPVNWAESDFSGLTLYKAITEFIVCSVAMRFRKL